MLQKKTVTLHESSVTIYRDDIVVHTPIINNDD